LIIKDNKYNIEQAKKNYSELVNEGVIAVIGPATSTTAKALLPLINEKKILTIAPTPTSTELAGLDDYMIRLRPTNKDDAEVLAKYVREKINPKKIVIVYDTLNPIYTIDFAQNFMQNFGKDVKFFLIPFKEGWTDIKEQSKKLPKKSPFPKAITPSELLALNLPRDFVISGIKSGSLSALVSPGGYGKSYLVKELCLALATATTFANGAFPASDKKQKVAAVFAEEDLSELQYRQNKILDNLFALTGNKLTRNECIKDIDENIQYFSADEYSPFLLQKNFNDITETPWVEWIEEIAKGRRLLILDPLASFFGGDENDAFFANKFIVCLRRIARKTNCAILLVHHTNKSATMNDQGHLQGAIRGSSAITDGVRFQMNLCNPSIELLEQHKIDRARINEFKCLCISKSNYIAKEDFILLENIGGILSRYFPNEINPRIL
jgi:ABC-type iron transport system FetAB ATPase subunit